MSSSVIAVACAGVVALSAAGSAATPVPPPMTPFPSTAAPSTGPPPPADHTVGAPDAGAGFVLPVPPPAVIVTPFRPPASRYGPGHRGVDLEAASGTVVRAAGAGRVVYAGMVAGRGVVSIEHEGGLRTTYEPIEATVDAGQWVERGAPVGVVEPGHPDCAPAACLHFGARLPGRVYLDPMTLIGPPQVRLKPWRG